MADWDSSHAGEGRLMARRALTNFAPPLVTALPSNPVDGQEVYFRCDASGDGASIIWHLRYRAGSSQANKWEFVGGPPMFHHTGSQANTTSVTTQGFVDSGGAGPVMTVPLAGVYLVRAGYEGWSAVAGRNAQAGIGVAGATDPTTDPVNYNWGNASSSAAGVQNDAKWEFQTRGNIVAGTVFKMLFWRDAIAAYTFRQRYLAITPVRVG
jgi:hypothetical protein